MKKKNTGIESSARNGSHETKRARHPRVILNPKGPPSDYAQKALRVFSEGVQDAYAKLAKQGVATVVIVAGQEVRGVPHKANGRFVVAEKAASPRSR